MLNIYIAPIAICFTSVEEPKFCENKNLQLEFKS